MSAPKLYGDMRSPCVRSVVFASKLLNIHLEYIPVDIFKREQYKQEFLKINPTHTVPTLDDNGFILFDSHAIMIYLAEKYHNDHPLYPKGLEKRSKINQMLYFECGKIFGMHGFVGASIFLRKEIPQHSVEVVRQSYGFLDAFLKESKYLTGDEMSIADLSVWTTLTNSQIYLPVDDVEYPRLAAYLKLMDGLQFSETNQKGRDDLKKLVNSVLQ